MVVANCFASRNALELRTCVGKYLRPQQSAHHASEKQTRDPIGCAPYCCCCFCLCITRSLTTSVCSTNITQAISHPRKEEGAPDRRDFLPPSFSPALLPLHLPLPRPFSILVTKYQWAHTQTTTTTDGSAPSPPPTRIPDSTSPPFP